MHPGFHLEDDFFTKKIINKKEHQDATKFEDYFEPKRKSSIFCISGHSIKPIVKGAKN